MNQPHDEHDELVDLLAVADGPIEMPAALRAELRENVLRTAARPLPGGTGHLIDLDEQRHAAGPSRDRRPILVAAAALVIVVVGAVLIARPAAEAPSQVTQPPLPTAPRSLEDVCDQVRALGVDNGVLLRPMPVDQIDERALRTIVWDLRELAVRTEIATLDDAATRVELAADAIADGDQASVGPTLTAARDLLTDELDRAC